MSDRDTQARRAASQARPSSSGWFRANCPFCLERTGKEDRKQAWSILMSKGIYHCFKCAVAGRIRGWEGSDDAMPEAEILAPPVEIEAPEGFVELMQEPCRSSFAAEAPKAYLRSRGLTDESVWAAAHLGVCFTGKQAGRIIVPILSTANEWLGWVGRVWQKKAPLPYIYPRGMPRGQVLYNHDALLVKTLQPVLVVEGVLDALAFWPHAVALLGKVGGEQMDALVASRRPVAVVLDGDAWREGEALALSLRLEGQRAGNVRLPPGKDPDEMNKTWVWEKSYACLEE